MGIVDKIKTSEREGVKRVIGVDASTNSFAFCIYDHTGPVRWGEVNFKGSSVFERLAYAQQNISAMRSNLEADLIVFESAIYVQNKKTVILLAYAFGAIISALMTTGARVEQMNPLEWQNAIGNKVLSRDEKKAITDATPGKSKTWYSAKFRDFRKQRTMDWVSQTFGITVSSDNVSDAIALAHVAYQRYGEQPLTTK